jgi:vacuolar-type H+-ATPase subunit E/Vma4
MFITCNCSDIASAGGVVVLGHGGKIELDNTFEERLKLLESSSLPKIRASIFGYVLVWFPDL